MQEDEKMEKMNLKTDERAAATIPFTTQMLQKPNSTERQQGHSARPRMLRQEGESRVDE